MPALLYALAIHDGTTGVFKKRLPVCRVDELPGQSAVVTFLDKQQGGTKPIGERIGYVGDNR